MGMSLSFKYIHTTIIPCIFVKCLSSLNFTFSSQDVFFSTSFYVGRYWGRPNKGHVRAYQNDKYPSTASEFTWLPNEIKVHFCVGREMEAHVPPMQTLELKWSSPGTGSRLKMTKCHIAFGREVVNVSITWRWHRGLQDLITNKCFYKYLLNKALLFIHSYLKENFFWLHFWKIIIAGKFS